MKSFNPCEPNPCQNRAHCVNIHGWKGKISNNRLNIQSDYYCVCLKGWTGQNCTEDVDDCVNQPCLNGGTCEDQPNMQFHCHCPTEFVGQTCEYRNPCHIAPCLNGGVCQSDPFGQFTCICPKWYSGIRCEKEINPCFPDSPCFGKNSTCHLITSTNRTLSGPPFSIYKPEYIVNFKCECGSGYFGRFCAMKQNLCEIHSCQNGATCLQNGEHYSCLCPVGFTGRLCNISLNFTKHAPPIATILLQNQTSKLNVLNNNVKQKFGLFNDYCYHIGCNTARPGDGICQAKCIYANCLNVEQELKQDCQYWIKCLQLTEHIVKQYNQTTCVEQFKNGECQSQCNLNECYLDGFDCMQFNSYCEPSEFCQKSYGNGVCQQHCNNLQCGYDGGDCLTEQENEHSIRKYLLFKLNTDQSHFMQSRNQFLGNLGQILQALVRIAKDEITGEDLVEDIPSKYRIKLLLEVTSYSMSPSLSCEESDENSCINSTVLLLKTNQLKEYILAALSTNMYKSLFTIIYFTFVDSPSQSHFKALWEEESSSVIKISKEAIGLYVFICILAGITIVLVLFLVFQRDNNNNWQKPLKRVRTKGIWCPPIPPIYFKPNQIELFGQQNALYFTGINSTAMVTTTSSTTSTTTNEPKYLHGTFKQTSTTYFKNYLDPLSIDEKEKFLLSDSEKYKNEKSVTRMFADEVHEVDDISVSGCTPALKKRCLNPEKVMREVLSDDGHSFAVPKCIDNFCTKHNESYQYDEERDKCQQQESQLNLDKKFHSSMLQANQETTDSSDLNLNKQITGVLQNSQKEISCDNSMNDELVEIIASMDGLHPCNVVQQNQIEKLLTLHDNKSRYERRLSDYTKDKEYLEANVLENNPQYQSILHLAAQMNAGHDVITKICHNACDKKSFNSLFIDSSGRTALTSAAAANSLESINSLYHLEREALANKKSIKPVKSQQTVTSKTNFRSRKRYQAYKSRHCTPIIAAIQAGNDEVVKILLDEGCPYNTTDQYGRNVVHWAAVTNSITTLNRLAQCKGFTRLMNMKDDWERTPIMLAIREGCQEAVEFLLNKQAKIEIIDCMENDCLSLCTEKGYERIHELLINFIRSRGLEAKSSSVGNSKLDIIDENQERTPLSIPESASTTAPVNKLMTTSPTRVITSGVTAFDWVSLSDNTNLGEISDCDRFTEGVDDDDDDDDVLGG
ncbi:unnamed protein product [Heterobilharzia americana]|nr:unnamed protein product [Heterobilharzia americana]